MFTEHSNKWFISMYERDPSMALNQLPSFTFTSLLSAIVTKRVSERHFGLKETHRVRECLRSGANAHSEDYASDPIHPRCSA